MHSTRFATFLLGAWMGCSVFLDLLAIQNLRLAGRIVNRAIPAASAIIQNAGGGQASLLLHHFAAEQYRYYFSVWGWIQLPAILVLGGVLYIAAEKRIVPQIICLAILALVVFELSIHSELVYRGREADFPPGSLSLGTQARALALMEIWMGVEAAKLALGAVLTGLILAFKSKRRSRRSRDSVVLVKAD